MDIYLFAAKEFILAGNKILANNYLDKIIDGITAHGMADSKEKQILLAESLYYREKYLQAETILEELLTEDPSLITQTALLAVVYHKNGKPAKAVAQINNLEGLRANYQYGTISYALAQYYAAVADEKNAIDYLTKAVAEGHWYETSAFQNDPFFKAYLQTDKFKRVLSYWH